MSLRIVAFSTGSTRLDDTVFYKDDKPLWQDLHFSSIYPGGLYGDCTFAVKGDITADWPLKETMRVKVFNGQDSCWEGRVTRIGANETGWLVTCIGYWADVLMARKWRKPWCDMRLDEGTWVAPTAKGSVDDVSLLQIVQVDRQNRIRFTPKNVAFANNGYGRLVYTAPTGITVKRVTWNYDLQEAGQQWTIAVYGETGATVNGQVAASGTGSKDVTLATPSQKIWLYFQAAAAQTPPSDGTIYGEFSNVKVYTETGSINGQEIAKDIAAHCSELSTDLGNIGALTYTLEPFISEVDSLADILIKATGYGDASFNAWAAYLANSDLSSDDKPVLFLAQQPALTDYDYAVRLDEVTLMPGWSYEKSVDDIRNWIAVQYTDDAGVTKWVTPDDDANLKDVTLITNYGQREEWLTLDTTSVTTATNYGRRFLAKRKDLQWKATGQIVIKGNVRAKAGNLVDACMVTAGSRIKIENFLNDLSGTGLTLLITATDYNDADQTNALTVGRLDTFDIFTVRLGGSKS